MSRLHGVSIGLELTIFLKELIKLTTLARKTEKKTVVKVKPAFQEYRVY